MRLRQLAEVLDAYRAAGRLYSRPCANTQNAFSFEPSARNFCPEPVLANDPLSSHTHTHTHTHTHQKPGFRDRTGPVADLRQRGAHVMAAHNLTLRLVTDIVCEKMGALFLSAFPMFVPSLSWQNDAFLYRKRTKSTVFLPKSSAQVAA
eukprot:COSAG06_NODE_6454_length_2925_cov_3.208776_1_plen_149_part_00